jgi:DNA-binding LacI/PurR family transcriptional regulator
MLGSERLRERETTIVTSSAEVAARAGVSRSTVSQILNGHEDRFAADTVDKVLTVARGLGYRPSLAGRTLARGTSDIVLTLIPDITIGPRLRELIDVITEDLAAAGLTNLIHIGSRHGALQDAVLGLRPFGVISLGPLLPAERDRLTGQGVVVIEPSAADRESVDAVIGRLQAQHLAAAGYETIVVASPTDEWEQPIARGRAAGVLDWCRGNGHATAPSLSVVMEPGGPAAAVSALPDGDIGIAAYNDEVALAVLLALQAEGRGVPDEVGIIGVDNTRAARLALPTIATIDFDPAYSGHGLARAVLHGWDDVPREETLRALESHITVVPGHSIRGRSGA